MLSTVILMIIMVSANQVTADTSLNYNCEYFRNVDGFVVANYTHRNFLTMPWNIATDVQILDLRWNYIGKLSNNSFTSYTDIEILLLSFNRVHTIEAGSLEVLRKLRTLDLTQNAVKVVPAGLPNSLVSLYLGSNPLKNTLNLNRVTGLQVLHLNHCELDEYPLLVSKIVELDVSDNVRLTSLKPIWLAETCTLTKLNITNTNLFPKEKSGVYCDCQHLKRYTDLANVKVVGLIPCSSLLATERRRADYGHCNSVLEDAWVVYKACMSRYNLPIIY